MELLNVRFMSIDEYCDFVESRSLHMGVSAFELILTHRFELDLISDSMYERAKSELLERSLSPIWRETEHWRKGSIR
jgi:hypothetical protein